MIERSPPPLGMVDRQFTHHEYPVHGSKTTLCPKRTQGVPVMLQDVRRGRRCRTYALAVHQYLTTFSPRTEEKCSSLVIRTPSWQSAIDAITSSKSPIGTPFFFKPAEKLPNTSKIC